MSSGLLQVLLTEAGPRLLTPQQTHCLNVGNAESIAQDTAYCSISDEGFRLLDEYSCELWSSQIKVKTAESNSC